MLKKQYNICIPYGTDCTNKPNTTKEVIMPQNSKKIIEPRKVYEDFHKDVPFWMAIADGVLKYHKLGYIDEDGRLFDPIGFFIKCDK